MFYTPTYGVLHNNIFYENFSKAWLYELNYFNLWDMIMIYVMSHFKIISYYFIDT